MKKIAILSFIFSILFSTPVYASTPIIAEEVLFDEQERFMELIYDSDYYVELDENEIDILSKVLYGEAGGVQSDTEKAAVVWCILNRVDDDRFPDTITGVITEPCQFDGYSEDFPIREDLRELVIDVLRRWNAEKEGYIMTGRVLPENYLYFWGDGEHNHFAVEWGGSYDWDWSNYSPYDI